MAEDSDSTIVSVAKAYRMIMRISRSPPSSIASDDKHLAYNIGAVSVSTVLFFLALNFVKMSAPGTKSNDFFFNVAIANAGVVVAAALLIFIISTIVCVFSSDALNSGTIADQVTTFVIFIWTGSLIVFVADYSWSTFSDYSGINSISHLYIQNEAVAKLFTCFMYSLVAGCVLLAKTKRQYNQFNTNALWWAFGGVGLNTFFIYIVLYRLADVHVSQ
jgi:hypothetical protein